MPTLSDYFADHADTVTHELSDGIVEGLTGLRVVLKRLSPPDVVDLHKESGGRDKAASAVLAMLRNANSASSTAFNDILRRLGAEDHEHNRTLIGKMLHSIEADGHDVWYAADEDIDSLPKRLYDVVTALCAHELQEDARTVGEALSPLRARSSPAVAESLPTSETPPDSPAST